MEDTSSFSLAQLLTSSMHWATAVQSCFFPDINNFVQKNNITFNFLGEKKTMNERKKERCKDWPNDDETAVPVPTNDGLTSIDIISNELVLYFIHSWRAIPLKWILSWHHHYMLDWAHASVCVCIIYWATYCSWSPFFLLQLKGNFIYLPLWRNK